ncbi:hypothetical protein [Saccharothrix obliqua]|uniref:hypothetical protein n=1 Tax=Saccharothrix obliqua TaxID=2861747 RepID=UPI001C6061BB|nr:hypothetical protein [Saccharothrix obliqua]MBW4716820.1 hypothetical protein [Saccharothrix obliqua]
MRFDVAQVLAMVVLALSVQGAIRILLDHAHGGLLDWLPGGFPARLATYATAAVIGAVVAGWAHRRAKKLGRR